jgi:Zn-finger nucleic acid-binding protein
MTDTATLICPKCGGEMRTYERNGVLVDQCTECRGIFLDRGELEQLLDEGHRREPRDEHDRDDRDHDRDHRHGHEREREREHEHEHDYQGKGRRNRASTFISDLLGGGE